jgi:hypothetical protein
VNYLAVKSYREHQHYKGRNPVWIKLYNRVMDDEAFLALSDAARGHLMLIWLLASRRHNKLPNDPKHIARAIQASGRVNLAELIDAGFLVPWDESLSDFANPASTEPQELLDDSRVPAMPEKEREREKETDRETESSSSAPVAFDAVAALLALVPEPSRPAWRAEIAAAREGMHTAALTAEQIQTACRDYLGNNAEGQRSLRHFRGYLRSIGTPREAVIPRVDGEAGRVFAAIRQMELQTMNPGRGVIRSIPKTEVAKLGATALAAYEQVGGAERFLAANGDNIGFLLRDFEKAYRLSPPHAGAA